MPAGYINSVFSCTADVASFVADNVIESFSVLIRLLYWLKTYNNRPV